MKRFALTVTTLVLAIGLSTLAFAEAAGKVDPKGAPAAGAAAPAKPVGAEAGGHQPAPLPAEVVVHLREHAIEDCRPPRGGHRRRN